MRGEEVDEGREEVDEGREVMREDVNEGEVVCTVRGGRWWRLVINTCVSCTHNVCNGIQLVYITNAYK